MYSIITHNIKVSVVPEYDRKNSFPSGDRFVFRYNIVIENLSDVPVKLMKRRWLVHDFGFGYSEVCGDGVIGLLPEIHPKERFTYFSNVILKSALGNMHGSYLFLNMNTQEFFESSIPKFHLLSSILMN